MNNEQTTTNQNQEEKMPNTKNIKIEESTESATISPSEETTEGIKPYGKIIMWGAIGLAAVGLTIYLIKKFKNKQA